jgi:hypothetical protein
MIQSALSLNKKPNALFPLIDFHQLQCFSFQSQVEMDSKHFSLQIHLLPDSILTIFILKKQCFVSVDWFVLVLISSTIRDKFFTFFASNSSLT